MSQPANDDYSQHLSDDEASYHEDASDNGTATNKPKQQQQQLTPTTTTISNIKLPILKKEEYDIWAMEMEHYLEYIDNDVWKVIQNGNSKKRISTGKDGVVRILPPVSAAEIHAVEKERKARTILLMAIPKEHLRRFHGMDDAKEIWEAIRTRFGGNANSKKMQKAVLKQQFEAFTISSSEGLEKGYDSKRSTNKDCKDAIRMKRQGFQGRLEGESIELDGNKPVGFDKKKLECFKCHNTGHFAREYPSNGINNGKKKTRFIKIQDHPLKNMEDRGIFDSGCSRHMTGNKDHLDDFEECKGGSVTFGGSKGYITGKGRIRVLFTEIECLVVSPDFKMPDENQILIKVLRQHNMYSFDMKTLALTKDYACLIAKATSDESKIVHMIV
ncbi:ribonuclease H-like domain-containing protein [Tanacetum coccineum]